MVLNFFNKNFLKTYCAQLYQAFARTISIKELSVLSRYWYYELNLLAFCK
jgi:hypothetical protein